MTTRPLRSALAFLALAYAISAGASYAQTPTVVGQPTQLSFFGMNTYFTGLERNGRDGDAGVSTLIARSRQLGAAWAREELSWANLERDGQGRWLWTHFDRRLLEVAQAGYGIIGMLLTTPAWARVGDCSTRIGRYAAAGVVAQSYWCPPADPQTFANDVFAVVERYDGDGNADAPGSPRVAVWQIWNEPNAWETWPGTPAEYTAILQAGYAAAKAADPTATVATGGLYVLDSAWQDTVGHSDGLRFLAEGLTARPAAWYSFDALAIHPYMPDVAPDQPGIYGAVTLWGRLVTTRAWLSERTAHLGGPPRPIWISELGWSTCAASESDCYAGAAVGTAALSADAPPNLAWHLTLGPTAAQAYATEPCSQGAEHCAAELAATVGPVALIGKSEQQQANYLVRAHAIALALGVQHVNWFQLEDKFDGSARNFWEEAALYRTAALGYVPKPAALAYSVMVNQLGAATFVGFGPLHTFVPNPTGPSPAARFDLRFRTANNLLVDIVWRTDGTEEVTVPLIGGRVPQIFSRDGAAWPTRVVGGVAAFSLGEAPVYVWQRTWLTAARLMLPIVRQR